MKKHIYQGVKLIFMLKSFKSRQYSLVLVCGHESFDDLKSNARMIQREQLLSGILS